MNVVNMDNAREYYNKTSSGYASKWSLQGTDLNKPANFYRKTIIDTIIEMADIKANDKVVEIGCGTGLVLREALKKVFPVFGVDISIEMLKRVQDTVLKDKRVVILEDFLNIKDIDADVFLATDNFVDLHIPKGYFNKILSMEVLRYVGDMDKALNNVKDIIKEDTVFVFSLTNLWSFSFFPIKYLLRKRFGLLNENNELLQYFVTENFIRKKLKEKGMEIIRFEKLNLLNFNPFFRRFIRNRDQAEKITLIDKRLSSVPLINKLFDTFLIAVKRS